jgi:hypothetical protein
MRPSGSSRPTSCILLPRIAYSSGRSAGRTHSAAKLHGVLWGYAAEVSGRHLHPFGSCSIPPAVCPPRQGTLARWREMVRQFTPNWFTATMGTGILALALNQFPRHIGGLHTVAQGLWLLNIVLFLPAGMQSPSLVMSGAAALGRCPHSMFLSSPLFPSDGHPCKLSRAIGPRNPMKIA